MEKSIDIKALADYAVSEGTQNTEDGRWETSYEELYNHFGMEISPNDEACKELAEALRQRNEVRGLTITEDGIDVSYDTLFCKNLTLEGVSPMLERHPAILRCIRQRAEYTRNETPLSRCGTRRNRRNRRSGIAI